MNNPPPADDDTRRAGRLLGTALRAAGVLPITAHGEDDWAVTTTFAAEADRNLTGIALDPDPATAEALTRRLHQADIDAEATLTDAPAALITVRLRTAHDAHHLARHVLAQLTPPRAAAHRLRSALARAGIRADDTTISGDMIDVGFLRIQHAAALLLLLPGPVPPPPPVTEWDWTDVETLADHLSAALETLAGRPVSVEADPACSSCIDTRDHGVRIGYLTEQQAHRLATIAANAAASTPPVT